VWYVPQACYLHATSVHGMYASACKLCSSGLPPGLYQADQTMDLDAPNALATHTECAQLAYFLGLIVWGGGGWGPWGCWSPRPVKCLGAQSLGGRRFWNMAIHSHPSLGTSCDRLLLVASSKARLVPHVFGTLVCTLSCARLDCRDCWVVQSKIRTRCFAQPIELVVTYYVVVNVNNCVCNSSLSSKLSVQT